MYVHSHATQLAAARIRSSGTGMFDGADGAIGTEARRDVPLEVAAQEHRLDR